MMCLKGGVLVLTFARSWFFNYLKLEANAVGFVEFLKYCMSCCCRCLYLLEGMGLFLAVH